MYCKYCGKELKEDAVFCQYCGKKLKEDAVSHQNCGEDQRKIEADTKAGIKAGIKTDSAVFLILTILLTAFIPFRLAGTRSGFAFLLMIPTLIACIGCWTTFAGSGRERVKTAGLTLLGGGLCAQVWVFLAEGIAVAVTAAIAFGNFFGAVRSILERFDALSGFIAAMVSLCAVLVICWLILLVCLRRIRLGIRSGKSAVTGRDVRRTAMPAPKITRFAVAAAVCTVFRLCSASGFYFLWYFLLYPRRAVAEGAVSELFGSSASGGFSNVLNQLIRTYERWSGAAESGMNRFKDAFLKTQTVNGMQITAAVLILAVLACVIALLVRARRSHKACP